ncbi:period circadian protein homolog 2 [Anolis carolinensis]|uniref:Period circadian protein homolog 2 n=1 Tax=Anolis carolinensis TaxID=28377 RepID=G1KB77_ANOCA|nr:PREDICTED: period circadian protein homolog 2 [Anolis carolinensis]|eukprot:XP_008104509.1 PREDICTED: period circadian protein homolog 2 [Anolis carolinensis]
MSDYLEIENAKMIVESTDIQMKNEQNLNVLQEDFEMNGESSANDANEHYSIGHDSHSNEGEENGKETAMIMESLECYKSSELTLKSKTQKELIKTLQELKGHLPPDKMIKGKSNILATLKYALRSIKQVKANEEYYQLMMINESYPCGLDVLSYTVEDVENITTEYIMKNSDMFAVAVSLATGKILYISDQVASILHCKKDLFKNARFVEFLAPQDVSVFYSATTPYRLPSWSICSGVESTTQECIEEKSFFCRISAGKEHINEICYHPFRMTPYLIKVQNIEDQLCCVLLAEKVHSGYEAPRIPPNKRVFTTTHTPSCLFQDVDERAVPLLGYLPQDLIGTPVLMHLHPSDRPLMLAIHKKILQCGGQPFDYSPIRFCSRNGEYVTLDTSWSSFINPWSRKISFIIGRHKVRTGPLNEDVFAPHCAEEKSIHPNVQEITEQIHRLLLQPVHNSGSSGYGSLGSNGSHEHLMSVASSSDSNGNNNEDIQRIPKPNSSRGTYKDGPVAKNKEEYVPFDSRSQPENQKISYGEKPSDQCGHMKNSTSLAENDTVGIVCQRSLAGDELAWGDQPVYSYQQISCLDSVIRYLESCTADEAVKKKPPTVSNAVSPNSDIHRNKMNDNSIRTSTEESGQSKAHIGPTVLESPDKSSTVVGAHLTSLTLPGKPESVVSFTSQCSYSSTIVHVGDKKPQPEIEIIEDGPTGTEPTEGQLVAPQSNTSQKNQEKEAFKKLGLTKEVLAVHTQKEEQNFLNKCKEIKKSHIFQYHCNYYFQEKNRKHPGGHGIYGLQHGSGIEHSWKKNGKNRKSKSKRYKPHESSDSTVSGTKLPHRFPLLGPNATGCTPSDTSQASCPTMPFPAVMPAYPLPAFPPTGTVPSGPEASLSGLNESQDLGNNCALPLSQFPAPLVTPVVALVLPNYVYPQVNHSVSQTLYPDPPSFSGQPSFSSPSQFTAQLPFTPLNPFPPQTMFPAQPFPYSPSADNEKAPVTESRNDPSRSCTPQSLGPQDQPSTPLFQSRCSSPLQLNLLQLEEMPKVTENGTTGPLSGLGTVTDGETTCKPMTLEDCNREAPSPMDSPMEAQNSDTFSVSSDLLDILLQEDGSSSRSGVSAATESLGSGSNGCGMSGSGTGGSETSNTSKYFGSIDSSENNHKTKVPEVEESEQFVKYVLQDPIWLLMANTDDAVMMTYQIPSRNLEAVLKEDKLKLKQMQKFQPKFTEDQKRELLEVYPLIQKGGLPEMVANSLCMYCEDNINSRSYTQDEEEVHEMELNEMSEDCGENNLNTLNSHQ